MFTTSRLLVYGGLAISLCLTVTQAALSDVSCVNKYRINDYGIRSGHRLSVICNGSSVNIAITQEESRMDDYIALDYYCYHLNGSALESENLVRTLGPGNHNYNRQNIVPTNSRCVFVGCVEKYGIGTQWYYMKGNGSSCTNEVPETSSSIPTSSTVLVPTLSSLSSSISENITSSIFMPTPITSSLETPLLTTSFFDISSSSILYLSTLTTSYVANSFNTKSMNSSENTQKLTMSTSSVPITSEATSKIMASSSTMNTPIISSTATSEATSEITSFSTAITPSSPSDASEAPSSSIISNAVAVIFGVLVLVIVTLIISCFIVIACTRKAFSTKNKNLIVEIQDSKIFESMLPSEHLKESHSLRTICADLNFKETSNIDYKKNTTNSQETSCGSHTTATTTTPTDKLPHTEESIVSIEYSEGSGELVEGSCPALYDTPIITVAAQTYTYSSDYIVEENITVHSLMNSSYITVAEMAFS